jgi:hypothetical protein
MPQRVAEQIIACLEVDKESADDIGRSKIDAMIAGIRVAVGGL